MKADALASTPCIHVHTDDLLESHRDHLEALDGDDVVWGLGDGHDGEADMNEADARFFSLARQDVLDLAARVEELEALLRQARSLVECLSDPDDRLGALKVYEGFEGVLYVVEAAPILIAAINKAGVP